MIKNELDMGQLRYSIPKIERAIFYKFNIVTILLWIVMLLNFICISSVLYAMITKVSSENLYKLLESDDTLPAIKTTILSVSISVILVCLIGIPIGYLLSTRKGALYRLIESVTFIPLVLPPSVAGLALLMTFGKNGIVGKWLGNMGINLSFSFFAIVIVQVFVCIPFFIQLVKNGFDAVEKEVIEAAKVFGATEGRLLFQFYIPIGIKSIYAGIVLCILRAAGEFGATMMFAGNLVGKTQTITTRIYSLYQYDVMQAVALAIFQLSILLIPAMILRFYFK